MARTVQQPSRRRPPLKKPTRQVQDEDRGDDATDRLEVVEKPTPEQRKKGHRMRFKRKRAITGGVKRPRRFRPGTVALREIRKFQVRV